MKRSRSIPRELIEDKAHKIWQKRESQGKEGTAEGDWNEAKEYLEKHYPRVIFWWKVNTPARSLRNFWSLFRDVNSRDFALEIVKTLGIGLTALGLLFSLWEGLEDRRLTQERLVTERFSKAVEQLGQEKDITVRIGGIYALERIAKDYDEDHWTIMEVLTSYVRENSSLPPELKQIPENEQEREERQKELEKLPRINIDVQAILTVIRRREDPDRDRGKRIDLGFTNLKEAVLRGADLFMADLENATLIEAQNLTPTQIKSACNWSKAIYKQYESENLKYIEELKQDKASDPKEAPYCRI